MWINNHVDINIVYRNATNPNDGIVILGFEIAPRSQWYDPESWSDSEETGPKKLSACPYTPYERQSVKLLPGRPGEEGTRERVKKIFWTYSVHWEANTQIAWDNRWDAYLRDSSAQQIHLISIMNALIIVLFLMVPVISILKRTVFDEALGHHHPHGHAARVHAQHTHDEDETRWRLLGVEALRAPASPMALSVLLGNGVHVICMVLIVMSMYREK